MRPQLRGAVDANRTPWEKLNGWHQVILEYWESFWPDVHDRMARQGLTPERYKKELEALGRYPAKEMKS